MPRRKPLKAIEGNLPSSITTRTQRSSRGQRREIQRPIIVVASNENDAVVINPSSKTPKISNIDKPQSDHMRTSPGLDHALRCVTKSSSQTSPTDVQDRMKMDHLPSSLANVKTNGTASSSAKLPSGRKRTKRDIEHRRPRDVKKPVGDAVKRQDSLVTKRGSKSRKTFHANREKPVSLKASHGSRAPLRGSVSIKGNTNTQNDDKVKKRSPLDDEASETSVALPTTFMVRRIGHDDSSDEEALGRAKKRLPPDDEASEASVALPTTFMVRRVGHDDSSDEDTLGRAKEKVPSHDEASEASVALPTTFMVRHVGYDDPSDEDTLGQDPLPDGAQQITNLWPKGLKRSHPDLPSQGSRVPPQGSASIKARSVTQSDGETKETSPLDEDTTDLSVPLRSALMIRRIRSPESMELCSPDEDTLGIESHISGSLVTQEFRVSKRRKRDASSFTSSRLDELRKSHVENPTAIAAMLASRPRGTQTRFPSEILLGGGIKSCESLDGSEVTMRTIEEHRLMASKNGERTKFAMKLEEELGMTEAALYQGNRQLPRKETFPAGLLEKKFLSPEQINISDATKVAREQCADILRSRPRSLLPAATWPAEKAESSPEQVDDSSSRHTVAVDHPEEQPAFRRKNSRKLKQVSGEKLSDEKVSSGKAFSEKVSANQRLSIVKLDGPPDVHDKQIFFEYNGDLIPHAPLPSGWEVRVSKSKNRPFYVHPDWGRSWHCPVINPLGDHVTTSLSLANSTLTEGTVVEGFRGDGATLRDDNASTDSCSRACSSPHDTGLCRHSSESQHSLDQKMKVDVGEDAASVTSHATCEEGGDGMKRSVTIQSGDICCTTDKLEEVGKMTGNNEVHSIASGSLNISPSSKVSSGSSTQDQRSHHDSRGEADLHSLSSASSNVTRGSFKQGQRRHADSRDEADLRSLSPVDEDVSTGSSTQGRRYHHDHRAEDDLHCLSSVDEEVATLMLAHRQTHGKRGTGGTLSLFDSDRLDSPSQLKMKEKLSPLVEGTPCDERSTLMEQVAAETETPGRDVLSPSTPVGPPSFEESSPTTLSIEGSPCDDSAALMEQVATERETPRRDVLSPSTPVGSPSIEKSSPKTLNIGINQDHVPIQLEKVREFKLAASRDLNNCGRTANFEGDYVDAAGTKISQEEVRTNFVEDNCASSHRCDEASRDESITKIDEANDEDLAPIRDGVADDHDARDSDVGDDQEPDHHSFANVHVDDAELDDFGGDDDGYLSGDDESDPLLGEEIVVGQRAQGTLLSRDGGAELIPTTTSTDVSSIEASDDDTETECEEEDVLNGRDQALPLPPTNRFHPREVNTNSAYSISTLGGDKPSFAERTHTTKLSLRILNPPHPLCSLQRLDQIRKQSATTKQNAKKPLRRRRRQLPRQREPFGVLGRTSARELFAR